MTGGWEDSSADDDLRREAEDTRPGVGGDPYPTVAYLVPPEGADTSCLLGSESLCSVEDVRASLDDITSLDLDAAAEAVVVEGATDEEEELILAAWALLQDNVDLVKWAWCWATGETAAGDCAVNHIQGGESTITGWIVRLYGYLFGSDGLVTVEVADPPPHKIGKWATGYYDTGGGGRIKLWDGVENPFRLKCVQAWRSDAYGADRYCAVVDLACVLMHELGHVCFRTHVPEAEDFPDWLPDSWSEELAEWLSEYWPDCDLTYVAENVFRWAIYRRYPFVLRSDCCPADRVGADDARFGSTRSLSMTDACNPYEPGSYDASYSGWIGPKDDDHAITGRWARWA